MSYQPRIVDAELADRLKAAGAVVIEGAKACGKTATARQVAASEVLLDVDDNARAAVAINPAHKTKQNRPASATSLPNESGAAMFAKGCPNG